MRTTAKIRARVIRDDAYCGDGILLARDLNTALRLLRKATWMEKHRHTIDSFDNDFIPLCTKIDAFLREKKGKRA